MDVLPDSESARLYVSAPEFDARFEVCGACPVQGFGEVRGRELYFRARHNGWSFEVANEAGELPSDGYAGGFYREGDYPNAGHMRPQDALDLISECLREFTGA